MSVSQSEVDRVLCSIARGEKAEWLSGDATWKDVYTKYWGFDVMVQRVREGHVRLKPAPAIRQWKPHEARGQYVREKGLSMWVHVDGMDERKIYTSDDHEYTYSEALDKLECLQPDGSVGPCGVVEGEG